jgi:hypothetical protein
MALKNSVPKTVFAAVVCAAFLAETPSMADEYRPDEFLRMDLSKAALSPKPLGPPAQFEPVPVEGNSDPPSKAVQVDAAPVHVDAPPKQVNAAPKHVNAAPKHVNAAPKAARTKIARARPDKPHRMFHVRPAPAPTKLVRRHTNPLDAQASDTRIQVWPCRSGGICNWRRPAQGE